MPYGTEVTDACSGRLFSPNDPHLIDDREHPTKDNDGSRMTFRTSAKADFQRGYLPEAIRHSDFNQ